MSTSCEPPRTSAYSEDLRWRMVWQSELPGYSQQTIAQNLGVDQSTVIVHVTKITCPALPLPLCKIFAFNCTDLPFLPLGTYYTAVELETAYE